MKFKRILAAGLALLMFGSSLAACGEPPAETEDTEAATSAAEADTESEIKDDLPDNLNYEGDEVTIVSRYREGWTSGEIAVEKINNEPVNDAVYERNKMVETRLGVTINSVEMKNDDPTAVLNEIATVVKSGSDDYDIVACACYVTINESLNGTFADMRSTEYIDFDKPYWSQGFNEVVEYKGAQYVATGSIVLSTYRFAFVTLFNKQLFTEAQVPYLYDDVKNYEWTLDKQISLVPLFHRDDGDGVVEEEGDIYGLVTTDYISVDPYWSSCKVPIIEKDADTGDYTIVFDSGRLFDVTEKLIKLYYETDGGTYDYKHYGLDEEQNDIRKMFAHGGAAMATVRLMELESGDMRNMEDEFGVLPMPMYDTQQKEYRTLLHDQFTVMAIPTTVTGAKLDQMSAVLECMASEGHTYVRPAYFETALRYKYMKDPESWEMMEIIIDNIYIDAGIIYTNALSSFHDGLRKIMGAGTNTVASAYKSKGQQAERSLTKMVSKLEKIPKASS